MKLVDIDVSIGVLARFISIGILNVGSAVVYGIGMLEYL